MSEIYLFLLTQYKMASPNRDVLMVLPLEAPIVSVLNPNHLAFRIPSALLLGAKGNILSC